MGRVYVYHVSLQQHLNIFYGTNTDGEKLSQEKSHFIHARNVKIVGAVGATLDAVDAIDAVDAVQLWLLFIIT